MPEISIIVPVYNVEKYLNQCIDSILAQTFTDFELILVDDGSPDNSGKICDEYAKKDSRIKVIHKINGGVSTARNSGLNSATGKYIMFCDSDDWVEKNWCECLYKGINNKNVVLTVCGYKAYNENEIIHKEYNDIEEFISLKDVFDIDLSWAPWNKIFIKSQIDKYNIKFPENISLGEDARFLLSYISTFSGDDLVYFSRELTINYNNIGEGLSRNYPDNYWDLEKTLFNLKIEVFDKLGTDLTIYYKNINNSAYSLIFKSIENLFDKRKKLSYFGKYKELNNILKSKEAFLAQKSDLFFNFPMWYRFFFKQRITFFLYCYYIIIGC